MSVALLDPQTQVSPNQIQGSYMGWDSAKKVVTDAATTSTSLVDITGLSVGLAANSVYEFEALIKELSSADTNGTVFGVNYSASGASVAANVYGGAGSRAAVTTDQLSALNTATAGVYNAASGGVAAVILRGFLTTGANAGNLTIQHAKVTSGTTTSKAGSILKVKKL